MEKLGRIFDRLLTSTTATSYNRILFGFSIKSNKAFRFTADYKIGELVLQTEYGTKNWISNRKYSNRETIEK